MKQTTKRRQGFSLVELSIVILIIGIVIAGVTSATRLVYQFRVNSARALTSAAPVNSISGLIAWFETTNPKSFSDSEESDGVEVTTWYDINPQSPYKYTLVQNITANKPTYVSKGQSAGLPVLQSYSTPAATQKMSTTGVLELANNPSFTIFVVGSASNGGKARSQIFSIGDTSAECTQFSLNYWGTNLGNLQFNGGDKTFSMASSNMLAVYRVIRDGHAGSSTVNGSTTRLYFNSIARSSTNRSGSDCVPEIEPAPFKITQTSPVSETTTLTQFGEIIIFNRVLKSDEIDDIEEYLSKKWSIRFSSS